MNNGQYIVTLKADGFDLIKGWRHFYRIESDGSRHDIGCSMVSSDKSFTEKPVIRL